jgi:hypothetical protein
MTTKDTYNIYVLNEQYGIDYVISGLSPKIAESWCNELNNENIQFELKLVVKQVEEAV